jgi:Uncharacterized protein conserved in bacteria (DUF2252)
MSKISPGVLAPPHEIPTPGQWRARGRAGRERVRCTRRGWRPTGGRCCAATTSATSPGRSPAWARSAPRRSSSVPVMDPGQLSYRGRLCGWALARGHARTGRATVISGYLGEGTEFDCAIADFALAYADQNAKDHRCLMDAVANGRVQTVMGLSEANPQPRLTGPLLPRALTAGPGPAGPCGCVPPGRLPDVAGQGPRVERRPRLSGRAGRSRPRPPQPARRRAAPTGVRPPRVPGRPERDRRAAP